MTDQPTPICPHGIRVVAIGPLDIPIECKGCAEARALKEFAESTRDIELKLDDRDRQAVVLAMAHLAVERPGWDSYLRGIAARLDPGLAMFDEFKRTSLQPRPGEGASKV